VTIEVFLRRIALASKNAAPLWSSHHLSEGDFMTRNASESDDLCNCWNARLAIALAVVAAVAVAGCQTPNVNPFHEATTQLHSAVHQAYHTTSAQLDTFDAVDGNGNSLRRTDTNHPANRFSHTWAPRLEVIDAMVAYSESLAHVVQSGQQSKANAQAISAKVTELVKATPWAVYGEAADSIFRQVHALAVSVAQYSALAKAVGKADEPIQRVAAAMDKDLESVRRILELMHEDHLALIGQKYNHHLSYMNEVAATRSALHDQMLKVGRSLDGARLKLLEARSALSSDVSDTQRTEAQKKIDALLNKLEAAEADHVLVDNGLEQCEGLLARVGATESAYQAELRAARDARHASLTLLTATRGGIRRWAGAHRDLKFAIEQNRQPNVSLLLASALEIRETVQKIKNHE
jgi:hypothetical protein